MIYISIHVWVWDGWEFFKYLYIFIIDRCPQLVFCKARMSDTLIKLLLLFA
jgi:hypothetical protein